MPEIDLLVKNAWVVSLEQSTSLETSNALAIKDSCIVEMGNTAVLSRKYEAGKIIDAKDKYIFPGLVNTHTHLFQTMLKGLGRDLPLLDWLEASIRPNIPKFDPETVYYAAMVGGLDAIRSGTTTLLDYMYANVHPELCDAVIKAFLDLGLRGIMARGYSDRMYGAESYRKMVENTEKVMLDTERLLAKYQGQDLVDICLAPTAVWNMTTEGLQLTKDFAEKHSLLITMHLNETSYDDVSCLERFGKRTFPYLTELGLLDNNFLAVHCVYLEEEDLQLIKELGVKVSHNPLSNMLLGSGVAPVPELIRRGITVGLATDGAASNDTQDMLETLKISALLQKVWHRDPKALSAREVLRLATGGGAAALGKSCEIGSLAPGNKADFFIYNPLTAKSAPVHDPIAALVYSSGQMNIETVVIDGEIILEDGIFVKVDEQTILSKAQELAKLLTA